MFDYIKGYHEQRERAKKLESLLINLLDDHVLYECELATKALDRESPKVEVALDKIKNLISSSMDYKNKISSC